MFERKKQPNIFFGNIFASTLSFLTKQKTHKSRFDSIIWNNATVFSHYHHQLQPSQTDINMNVALPPSNSVMLVYIGVDNYTSN
jgi:hypothetical protein